MFQTIPYYSLSAVNLTIRFYFLLHCHFTRHPSHIRQPEKIYSLFFRARGALAPIKNDFTQTRFIIFFYAYIYVILK